ncbi:MAG: S1 RNA-binding domain-containing protein [Patescibacteria group bacterium]|nr:S1 RNA-binding domain-containing protein [Patescibacteria group bacterium]
MKELLEKNGLLRPPKVGEIVEGKVIGKKRAAVFLDLGPIGTGTVYGREFFEAKEELRGLKKGDRITAKIINLETDDGFIDLSISSASKELSFETLNKKKEDGEPIKIRISGANRGGLTAEISGISAFLPVSQLASEHYPKVEGGEKIKILKELQMFIGKDFEVKIIDIFPRKNQIILSEKAKDFDKLRKKLENYKVGDEVKGEITGVTDFGAFIKFDKDLEGLIHISELDWKIIDDPAEVVKTGDKVKAKIIEVSGDKVSLSLKALKKDPWDGVGEKYKKGDIISGKVTKFNPFGAFVQLSKEIQGLCHISEFESGKMEDVLELGKKYKFQVLSIDEKEHRMSLRPVKE